ncbi:hypothetical protein [Gymnodinialimonas sp. 57CJ19]|uniref:hypothetical protein n=1 Tax=Gymnodinialimonas sp. 57CJ19 TaxID=3138498 RepID=UPI0031343285
MSDPAKTPEEIEDVLASVRRLVSDHSPVREERAKPADPAPEVTPEPAQPDALVLTPSFRVTDPEDPWVPVEAPEKTMAAEDLIAELVTSAEESEEVSLAAEDASKNTPEPDGAEWQPDDRLASFATVGAVEDDRPIPEPWVSEPSEPSEQTSAEKDVADLIRLDGSEATNADFESETGDDNWPGGGAEAALLNLVARREPVSQESDAGEEGASEEAAATPFVLVEDTPEPDAAQGDTPEDEPTDDATETASWGTGSDDGEAAAADFADDDVEEVQPTSEHVEATDNAPSDDHGADGHAEDSNAPEAPETRPFTPFIPTPVAAEIADTLAEDRTDEGAANEETPAEGVTEDVIDDFGDAESPFAFPEADEGLLDEDTLREIIVEVVREELQGVLGQRITRNVRKMVRREIRLAMAAEGLE